MASGLCMYGHYVSSSTYRSSFKSILYLIKIRNRAPTFSDETFVRHIQIEHVHCVVDRLNFPHLYQNMHTRNEMFAKQISNVCITNLKCTKPTMAMVT